MRQNCVVSKSRSLQTVFGEVSSSLAALAAALFAEVLQHIQEDESLTGRQLLKHYVREKK